MDNNKISIIAPSSAGFSFEDAIAAKELLEYYHFTVDLDENILDSTIFHASSDEMRQKLLQKSLDSNSKFLWQMRGGYGAAKIIANIQAPSQEKITIGFSDHTALHIYFNQYLNLPSIHGRGLNQLIKMHRDDEYVTEIMNIVAGKTKYIIYEIEPLNSLAKTCKEITAKISGGNLSLIQTSIGTKWQFKPEGYILFIEEVNERGYKVDRMLEHLKQAGLFHNLSAIILGDFTGGDEIDGNNHIAYALNNFTSNIAIPTYKINGCGHGTENKALIFGQNSIINNNKLIMGNVI
jgi:muramoyltetrapeptide carboxypeptidase